MAKLISNLAKNGSMALLACLTVGVTLACVAIICGASDDFVGEVVNRVPLLAVGLAVAILGVRK